MKRDIGVVIVTYKRVALLERCLRSVLEQTLRPDLIYVVDNSPDEETGQMLRSRFPDVSYVHFPENIGSEGGYREGMSRVWKECGKIWLLDDDCLPDRKALAEMIEWSEKGSLTGKVGAIRSARRGEKDRGKPFMEIEDLFAWRGVLVFSDVVKNVGLPEGRLFLYAGDIEYGLRIRKAGYRIYLVFSSRIAPISLSEKTRRGRGLLRAECYVQAFRSYYAYRNELWVYRRYGLHTKVIKLLLHAVKGVILSFLEGNMKNALAIGRGIRDGYLGRLGKNPVYLPGLM